MCKCYYYTVPIKSYLDLFVYISFDFYLLLIQTHEILCMYRSFKKWAVCLFMLIADRMKELKNMKS